MGNNLIFSEGRITGGGGSESAKYLACPNGQHSIGLWGGDPYREIPEGTPCACGMTIVKYITCKECGYKRMKMVPREAFRGEEVKDGK